MWLSSGDTHKNHVSMCIFPDDGYVYQSKHVSITVTQIYIHDFSMLETILVVYCQLHRSAAYNIRLWTYNWKVRGANTGKDRSFLGFCVVCLNSFRQLPL